MISQVSVYSSFGPVVAQYFMVGARDGGYFSPPGNQEAKKRGRGQRSNTPFKDTSPMTSLPSTRPHSSKVSTNSTTGWWPSLQSMMEDIPDSN
jgi:hypothetical protein